jgi:hypothetical protein
VNSTRNPMTVQFWLWGLDAIAGDLTARGFQKLPRPDHSDSSVYRLGSLHLHGHGLWFKMDAAKSEEPGQTILESDRLEPNNLEPNHAEHNTEVLVYRRPSKGWYVLPKRAALCVEHFSSGGLAWCDFARPRLIPNAIALETIRPVILEHETWIATRHDPNLRERQLERVSSRPVRRARNAWFHWLGPIENRVSKTYE